MRKTKPKLSFCLTILIVTIAIPQDLPRIIPPSPEAAALAKFTEIPVSHYTGVPNITIPLYTIEQNGISVPISLNYHSRGIKVGEIAPRVGLGWALQYGGSISRQTRGGVDESQYGYLKNGYNMDFFNDGTQRISTYETYVFNPEYDFTPDLFHFNANGSGGKFMIDKADGEELLQDFDDIDIDYNNAGGDIGIDRFTITDKNGNTFYFGVSRDGLRSARNYDEQLEKIVLPMNGGRESLPGSPDRYYNNWQLMDIETSYGELIEFHYGPKETSQTFRHSYDKIENDVPTHHASKLRMHQFQLSEIRFKTGKLVFEAQTDREDLDGSHTLDKISLYDSTNQLIKTFELDYEYTNSPADNNVHDYLDLEEPMADKRLFLKSIRETAPNQDQLPPYVFEYNTEKLPNRFSTSQDLWGYYNGKDNGPYLTFFDYGTTNVDRTVDTQKAEAGMLKRITYPTRGSTTFEYEHNKGLEPPEHRNVVIQNVNPTVPKVVGLAHLNYCDSGVCYPDGGLYDGDKYSIPVNIGEGLVGSVYTTVDIDHPEMFEVYLGHYALSLGSDISTSIPPGNYTLVVDPIDRDHNPLVDVDSDEGIDRMDLFNVIIRWEEERENTEPGQVGTQEVTYAGGKRIKRIIYNHNNGLVRAKEYEYLDNAEETSGRIFGLPNFYPVVQTIGNTSILARYGAVPGSPMGTPQGNSIGYAKVTEYNGTKANNIGKIDYEFSVIPDAGEYYKFPYPLPTDNEWLRGKILKSEVFRRNRDFTYTLLKKTENTYLFGDILFNYYLPPPIFNPFGFSTQCNNNAISGHSKNRIRYHLPLIQFVEPDGTDCGIGGNLAYNTYYLTGGTLDLGRSVVTDYLGTGEELVTTTEYTYDYGDHYQLSETKLIDSEGLERITKNYYATDLNNTELMDRHRLAEPIRQESYVDSNNDGILQTNELLTRQETQFRLWGNNLYLPEYIKAQKGSGALENRIMYKAYDDTGNPLWVSKDKGPDISYIWGYNKQYPVAKVENTTRAQVDALTGFGTNFETGPGGLSPTQENRLRSDLPNALVTTYSYFPLIGLKTITAPNTDTIKYFYDPFNRLEGVKDRNDKMLSEYRYHFKE